MTTPEKLRDVARDAESDTHSAIWDYPAVLREAADEIERLRQALDAMQGHTFFCQDAEGALRRWYPPQSK
ncbi:hypothetical protein [Profundibacterium mesophilum]|uniref:Two-component system cell cycle sensor histidine kinase PleC n=1 Tax=Profundibacterium mesophilum KAUST100406-0324 TaxID=1037889 RepID=A0A921NTI9_9RHOB|nr:hypothetical protein [Profundibacterium mesophilum]KAF0674469.1 two-component system cell cycle sensor histidine kinase PleC [Profundibacterium mesophilum KAUST100406-0324]